VKTLKVWPFPILRNYPENRGVTKLFYAFAADDSLHIVSQTSHTTTVRGRLGELRFWTANKYYAYASDGLFQRAVGMPLRWNDEMPSRAAVRAMVRALELTWGKEVAV
jgi:hypothetical protein